MKRSIILLFSLFAFSIGAFAGNLKYGPWVHNVSQTGFTVLWITEKPSLDYVELAPDDGSPFERNPRRRYYQVKHGRRSFETLHCVRVDGLEPGSSYRYRLIGKEVKPETDAYRFVYGREENLARKRAFKARTLDPKADTCRFSMVNDIHFNDARFTSLTSSLKPESTDFLVLCGDIVSRAESIDSVVKHSFAPIESTSAVIPLVNVRGNHEGRGADFDKVYGLFPTATGEFYYTFRHGPAAFVVLDAGEDKPDGSCEYGGTADYDTYRQTELEWLKNAVKDPEFASAPVKICLIHVPTVDFRDSWYSQKWVTDNFGPVLEKAGIDVCLSGHHHKWFLSEAGKDGKNYPVISNSNAERMDVVVCADEIRIVTVGESGQKCRELTIPVK